jgi:hypothetical protein
MPAPQELTTESDPLEEEAAQSAATQNDSDGAEEDSDGESPGESSRRPRRDRATRNSAVARCLRAWNEAYAEARKELRPGESDYEAQADAKYAFLAQLPPLAGSKNVRNFLACLTYGQAVDILTLSDVRNFLEPAKVAVTLLRQVGARRTGSPGRPPKAKPEEENN